MLNADIRDFIQLLCYVQRGCSSSSKGNKINLVTLVFYCQCKLSYHVTNRFIKDKQYDDIDDQALNNQQVTTMHHACMLKDPVSLLWYEGGSETPATCQCYDQNINKKQLVVKFLPSYREPSASKAINQKW